MGHRGMSGGRVEAPRDSRQRPDVALPGPGAFRRETAGAAPDAHPKANDIAGGLRQGILIGVAVLAVALPPSRPDLPAAILAVAARDGAMPSAAQAPARVAMSTPAATAVASVAPGAAPGSVRGPAQAAIAGGADPVPVRHADFRGHRSTGQARDVADWIARTGDNRGRPFVVLDKRDATVYVFDRDARLTGASPVLLGFAPGDDSADGIGSRPLENVAAHEKTTPAGRFEGERGHDTTGEDIVWIDYDAAVAMHRVRVVDPKERRLERLLSPNPDDRRISYGCVNVPVPFFESVVAPLFRRAHAPVYVLPETKALQEVFGPGVTGA